MTDKLPENHHVCPVCHGAKTVVVAERFGAPGGTVVGIPSKLNAGPVWERHTPTVRVNNRQRSCIRCGGTGRVVRLPEKEEV